VAAIDEIPVAVITTILDMMVSDKTLTLDDDEKYHLILTPVSSERDESEAMIEQIKDAPEVTIEVEYDDTTNFHGETQTVHLPTSDLIAFLSNINLPPQMMSGLGALSKLDGFLTFEVLTPTDEDPRPSGKLRLTVYGRHSHVATALNPNQPGYVSPVTAALTNALTS
jgi:hypothetical protein